VSRYCHPEKIEVSSELNMATIDCAGRGLPRAASETDKPCPVCEAGPGELSVESRRASHEPFPAASIRDSDVVEYRKANRGDVPIRIVIPDKQIDRAAVLRRVE
jgi:hypothetical protein